MHSGIRLSLALLFAGVFAACSDTTGVPDGRRVDLEFGIERLQTEPAFVVSDGNGELKIRGYFHAPCSGYVADAEAIVAAGVILVRVAATPHGFCFGAIADIGYEATVHDLSSGSYRLRVVHTLPGSTQPGEVVLDALALVR
jgi:hypothetical protein